MRSSNAGAQSAYSQVLPPKDMLLLLRCQEGMHAPAQRIHVRVGNLMCAKGEADLLALHKRFLLCSLT